MEKMLSNAGGAKSAFTESQWLRKHLSRIYPGSKSNTLPYQHVIRWLNITVKRIANMVSN